MRGKKICWLLMILLTAMMLSGFRVVGPGGQEISKEELEAQREKQAVEEKKETSVLVGENKKELSSPENWTEVTDASGNLTIQVPFSAQQVAGTEAEEFICYELLDTDLNTIGFVRAAAYKETLPENLKQYTDAVPKTEGAYCYRYYSVITDAVSWDVWVGSPHSLAESTSPEYHFIANGTFPNGMNGFAEIDVKTDAEPFVFEELYEISGMVLQSASSAAKESSIDLKLVLSIVVAAIIIIILVVGLILLYHFVLKKKLRELKSVKLKIHVPKLKGFKFGGLKFHPIAFLKNKIANLKGKKSVPEVMDEETKGKTRKFRIPKEIVYILGALLIVSILMNQGNTPEPIPLDMESSEGGLLDTLPEAGAPVKTPAFAVLYAAALIALLELWDRLVISGPMNKKIPVWVQKAGSIMLMVLSSVVCTWQMFRTGILEKTTDAIILALYDKLYSIPFLTTADRIKAVSYLVCMFVVLICMVLLVRGVLRMAFAKIRPSEERENEVTEEAVEEWPTEDSQDLAWKSVQTENQGLTFRVPPGSRRTNDNVFSSSLGKEADKAEYTFSESMYAGVPKGSVTVALYGEPVLGMDSKFLKYSQLVDSLRNSVKSHENYKWTQKKINENKIAWDVWHGVQRSQGNSSEDSDYMFACCDFGDRTFGYVGASGVHSGDLGDEEVYAFLTTLLSGVSKK